MKKRIVIELEINELVSKKGTTYKRAEITFPNGYMVTEPIFDTDISKQLVYKQIMEAN